jgi:hypothetical protein
MKNKGIIATVSGGIAMLNVVLSGYACRIGMDTGNSSLGWTGFIAMAATLILILSIGPAVEEVVKSQTTPDEEDLEQWGK